MNIVLKNSLKNIFCKPFRTILVLFAIFMCSLCALLCFDLGSAIERIITDMFASVSRADIMVVSGGSDLTNLPDGFPEADYMKMTANEEMLYKAIDGEYCYVTTDGLSIYGVDIDEAVDMNFLTQQMEIGYGEMIVTKTFADEFGYEAGDKITVHDRAGEEVELTIGGFIPEDNQNPLIAGNTGIVNLETSDILTCGYREANVIMVDLKDNSQIEDAKKMLTDAYPDVSINDMFLTDSDMALVNEIKIVFYLMFAITFLLVIFVTASICNRIVSERMSFIGTLRSLGMNNARTARILLLENVLYALLGSVPATVLYLLVRNPLMNVMFFMDDGSGNSMFQVPKMSIALVIGVIVGAVVIECLIPLKAILKALKTSIRDIIFDNRDTEYKYSMSTFITGLVCLVIAVVTFFLRENIMAALVCLITTVFALSFLFPRLLKLISIGIEKLADKVNAPSWALAAAEARTRKSTVGSGVLSATAAAMCIVVYSVAMGMAGSLSTMPYDCNVVMSASKQSKYYTYVDHLEGVTGSEILYSTLYDFKLNDEDKIIAAYFYGLPDSGYKYFTGFENLPEKLEDGKCIIDKKIANRKGISVGDTIKLTINPEGVFPVVREYEVQDIVEPNAYDDGLEAIIISEIEFKAVFYDYPSAILIRCDDPESVKDSIETYGKGTYGYVKTLDELVEQNEKDNSKTLAVVIAIIAVAIGMTAIGMISNQLIGFEGRKKECAVLLSTAMNKAKLSGILLKEVLITSISASLVGTLLGTVLTYVIQAAIDNAESIYLDLKIDPLRTITFFVMLTVVFTLTVLFPIRNLRKMKISEQIKYE